MFTPKEKGGGAGANIFPYPIDFSCLFDGVDDYLSRTPGSSGDRKKFTFSFWFKPVKDEARYVLSAGVDINNYTEITINNGGGIHIVHRAAGSFLANVGFSGLVLDSTSHYHCVVQADTSQAVEDDRVSMWLNGTLMTLSGLYPPQNTDLFVNHTVAHVIMGRAIQATYTEGYVSDVYLLDGQTLDASAWGEVSEIVTGLRIPKNPESLSFGTNGSQLDFADAADLGNDVSGNNNNWIVNGSPVQTLDTPTNNHATINPLASDSSFVLSDGNRTLSYPNTTDAHVLAWLTERLPKTGKYYFEFEAIAHNGPYIGIANADSMSFDDYLDIDGIVGWYLNSTGDSSLSNLTGSIMTSGTQNSLPTIPDGTVLGFALDMDAGTLDLYVDGVVAGVTATLNTSYSLGVYVWVTSGGVARGVTGTFAIAVSEFTHTPPEGYTALCASSLPDPTILKSATVADLVMRVGTGSATAVAGLGFAPDFVSIKDREAATNWVLSDKIRGANRQLYTNASDAEGTDTNKLTAFNSDGYSLGDGYVNILNRNILNLCLKAGVAQGFEVVQYEGVTGEQQIPHSLGKVPTVVLIKRIDADQNWTSFWLSLGAGKHLRLNSANGAGTDTDRWNGQTPTPTYFTIGDNVEVGADGGTYMAYLFTDSDIFKAFSYTGNGLTDGPFINFGGKPLAIPFWKNSSVSATWIEHDNARNPYNSINLILRPESSAAEYVAESGNFTSQGLKITIGDSARNGSGNLHVGLAILESTKYSNAY